MSNINMGLGKGVGTLRKFYDLVIGDGWLGLIIYMYFII